jgi:hypothetical protein
MPRTASMTPIPLFQEFNRLADLLQPEDPLVYGGEVLHAV